MHDITMRDAFVPQGCEQSMQPLPAVTFGAGTFGMQAYDAVTTKGGKYVQGGGCLTVCLAGLIQSGGFAGPREPGQHIRNQDGVLGIEPETGNEGLAALPRLGGECAT
jgi:hypothetical protein